MRTEHPQRYVLRSSTGPEAGRRRGRYTILDTDRSRAADISVAGVRPGDAGSVNKSACQLGTRVGAWAARAWRRPMNSDTGPAAGSITRRFPDLSFLFGACIMNSFVVRPSTSRLRQITAYLGGALLLVTVLVGFTSPAALAATDTASSMPSWQRAIAKLPVPGRGCFTASYPAIKWRTNGCSSVHPKEPQQFAGPELSQKENGGDTQQVAGSSGQDFAAQTASPMTEADGSFPTVTCSGSPGCQVTETGLFGNQGTASSNVYSLQLNTNFNLPATASCATAAQPTACAGWQQFVYDSKLKIIQVEPALVGYVNTCTGTFNTSDGAGNCYDENENTQSVPQLTPHELSSDSVMFVGQANSGTDTVKLIVSGTSYAATAADSLLDLAGNWTDAQFGVYGDRGGGEANFSANTDLKVNVTTHSGTTGAPQCVLFNSTGESNNLFLQPAPTLGTQQAPAMESDQNSNQPTSPASCATAHGVGDTHLETFSNLLYDFQAQGDYELVSTAAPSPPAPPRTDTGVTRPADAVSTGLRFIAQERQVSGAPSWPNAAVNRAVAAQVGTSDVAVCTAPTRLEIDGRTVSLADGTRQTLPDGASVALNGNVYVIRDGDGNSVQATVQSGNTPHVDVSVGLGQWPKRIDGLLGNAGSSDNAIESRNGTVFTAPFAFSQIYGPFGTSWLVLGSRDLLSACNGKAGGVVRRNPTRPFYANDLSPRVAASARAACVAAGVHSAPLLDACTIDVAVLGDKATGVYRTLPAPAAWGVVGTGCRGSSNTSSGRGLFDGTTADACSSPLTSVVRPGKGATLVGRPLLEATASTGVASVHYELSGNGLKHHVITTANPSRSGWVARWDTTLWPNGTYTLQSVASDADGVTGTSPGITIRVRNRPSDRSPGHAQNP